MRLICLFLAPVFLLMTSLANAEIILFATPDTKTEVAPDFFQHSTLSGEEREKNRVVIERRGDFFFWASREDVELVLRTSGIYDIFVAVTGAGYVKVTKGLYANDPAHFLEHVHLGLSTVTYFGTTQQYRPDLLR